MFGRLALFRHLPSAGRVFHGGRLNDAGRLPRYVLIFVCAAGALWAPITAYVSLAPASYTSDVSLILPGSGAQSSVNLADLGQASSSAASAFSSTRISPTQTYKRLLAANRTIERAAALRNEDRSALGAPRIKLVDETSLIHFEMTGPSPEVAQDRAAALLTVFLDELDTLRQDELASREKAAEGAIEGYETEVTALREQMAKLQAESGLVSFDHYKDLVSDRDDLAARVEEARASQSAADASMNALAARLGTDAQTAALNLRLHADPEFQELADELAIQKGELAKARGRFGPRHPKVTSAEHAVVGTESRMLVRGTAVIGTGAIQAVARLDLSPDPARGALLSDLVDKAADCEARASTVAILSQQLTELDARIARLAPLAARLDDLSRDYQVAEAVFASALARTDTTKSDVYASYPLVQVLADATLPERPTSPRPKIAIAAGVAATLMLLVSLSLAWLRRPIIDHLMHRGTK
ncbi:MAG: hypothetical protein AAFR35_02275 [Pseudomonadota bacterium]